MNAEQAPAIFEDMNSRRVTLLGHEHVIHSFPAALSRYDVLAVHGFGTSGRCFRYPAPFLRAAGVSITAPDQLGFGESEKPESGYSLRLYAQLLVEAADEAHLESPFLMGHSAGGKVAAVAAALFPDRFRGLILVNSGGFSILAPVLLLADGPLFSVADSRFFRKRILRFFGIAETLETPEQWEAFRRFQGENWALDVDRSGLRQAIRSISMPTQVIWGLSDRMIPRGTIGRILRDIPHARVSEMSKAGHAPFYDDPETFSRFLVEFLEAQG